MCWQTMPRLCGCWGTRLLRSQRPSARTCPRVGSLTPARCWRPGWQSRTSVAVTTRRAQSSGTCPWALDPARAMTPCSGRTWPSLMGGCASPTTLRWGASPPARSSRAWPPAPTSMVWSTDCSGVSGIGSMQFATGGASSGCKDLAASIAPGLGTRTRRRLGSRDGRGCHTSTLACASWGRQAGSPTRAGRQWHSSSSSALAWIGASARTTLRMSSLTMTAP
mmetsp:Transcript_14974/g.35064  ORF Transcript_14974/g.35064 Transcript_14974/m.35064 type:complete len:222 (-) Transcript_14974:736-1401(-)